ncbi:hypothetical protein CXF76_17795 [Pseudoalteromonas sp. 78C3]|uniref:hypothetical protein n=1 Tax=Pseudoalteromonas sp. 78C3 TaxID=2058300 RepID=UPI000C34E228|nr:hypothetical protein [Pseudoalteromonas sp. 78C3]PKH90151.1 hypothetical protein CXF76_17795 [Pseudoalteromonas sp. 78C3]
MNTTDTKQLKDNGTSLDQFHEDLKSTADENNKVKFIEQVSPSFYLPPLSEFYTLIGFIKNKKQLFEFFETTYKTPLKLSQSSRYDLFNKGVGLRSIGKIVHWIKLIPFPLAKLLNRRLLVKARRSDRAGSNAGEWYSALNGFKCSSFYYSDINKNEFDLLFNFIEHRCNIEVSFLLDIKKEVKAGKLKSLDMEAAWKTQYPLWEHNPYIPKGTIEDMGKLALLHSQKKSLSEKQKLTFFEGYFYLIFDFYLEAITHYEVGCRIAYGSSKEKIENQLGMITNAINAYATDETINTCFSGMLKELKEAVSELVGDTGYRQLASFIEIEEAAPHQSAESLENRQYNQFKDWRKGINLPSDKKLTVFLDNLDTYANASSGYLTFDMCKIVMAVDKLIAEKLAQTKNETATQEEIEIIIKKVLSNIPSYYRANLKAGLEMQQPVMNFKN